LERERDRKRDKQLPPHSSAGGTGGRTASSLAVERSAVANNQER
jgi:hypothetical protein